MKSLYSDFIEKRAEQGLNRSLKAVEHLNAREIGYAGNNYVNFSGNDYLGLRFHTELANRAKKYMEKMGAGVGASRLVTGNVDAYAALEEKLAKWKGRETALIMNSGFQANASFLPALFDKKVLGDVPNVYSDKLIHASMHHGMLAAEINHRRFQHNNAEHLETLLEKDKGHKFILTESVFSMDGDVAPLEDLYGLRDKHDAMLIVDEAHSSGVFGDKGEGLDTGADIVISTFGKALGGFGACIFCDETTKQYLVNTCGGLIYATALPPAVLGAMDAAVDLVQEMSDERAYVQGLAQTFRDEIKALGLDCGESQSQIVPVILGDVEKTVQASEKLKEKGLWVTAIRPPTVPQGKARLRVSFSAAHTEDDVSRLVNAIKEVAV